jgi:integrase
MTSTTTEKTPATTALVPVEPADLVPSTLPASQHPALVYLASLRPGSRRTMTQALDVIAQLASGGVCDHVTLPWAGLRYQHTQAIRAALADRYSGRSANKMLSALRGVLKNAWRLGQIDAENYQRAIDVGSVEVSTPSQAEVGRHVTAGEFAALLALCAGEGTAAGVRDAALLAVGYACGLRRAELAALRRQDFDAEPRTLTVHGKRNKTRVVPIENGALDALLDWLYLRGDEPGALFTRIRKGDHLTLAGLTDQAVYNVIVERCVQAGVKLFAPHDLRRTFAGDLLDAGADIATVAKLMGHASVVTTAGYDRRDAQTKRKAVTKLHVPYVRKFGAPAKSCLSNGR